MSDFRRENRRRKGEGRGDRIFNICLTIVFIVLFVYGGWQFGRFYGEKEARKKLADQIEQTKMDLLKFKMWHYGTENFFFSDPKDGHLCYVTKAADLDNPKKWRRTR